MVENNNGKSNPNIPWRRLSDGTKIVDAEFFTRVWSDYQDRIDNPVQKPPKTIEQERQERLDSGHARVIEPRIKFRTR